jgi:hypothetical protein
MNGPRAIAGFAAAWVAVSIAMTWPVVRHATSALPADLGDPVLNTWILAWAAERLPHGLTGWWEAAVLYPYHDTLAFSEHLLGVALFTAPLQWASGNPVLAYNAAFIGSFALAGGGAYALARELRLDRVSAVLTGLLFAFSPYRFAQQSHVQVLMAGWMPVCLWALHRYLRRGTTRDLVWFVLAFLLQALSNGYYLFFLLVPVLLIVCSAAAARAMSAKRVYGLAAAGVVVFAALAPFAVAYMRARRMYGLHRTVDEVVIFSADLLSYLGIEPEWTRPWPAERMLWPGWVAAAGTVIASAAVFRQTRDSTWRRARPWVVIAFAGLTLTSALAHSPFAATAAFWGMAASLCVPFPRGTVGLYILIALAAAVLSLGPLPTVGGRPLLSLGPYLWLYSIVPGFDGLRVTARFGVLVQLAAAILAGFGIASVTSRLSLRARAAVVLILAAVSLAEAHSPIALATVGPKGRPPDAPLYRWLAQQPEGAVLELPIEPAGSTTTRSFLYEYATLTHRHRIVNGATGYSSPLQDFLGGPVSPLTDGSRATDVVAMLRALDVRYVVVHDSGWPAFDDVRTTIERLRFPAEQVTETTRFDGATVISLRRDEPEQRVRVLGEPVGAASIQSSAFDLPDRLALAFDGDPETRWFSGRPQRGDEWVALTFDVPRDIGEVLFRIHPRSLADYPRELTIESVDSEGTGRVLFKGSTLPLIGRGFLESGITIPMRVFLESNHSSTLRIRQTAAWRTYFWAIDELQVYERAH